MARPLRIHPPGGYHHVTARGNDRLPIFIDDADRWSFLGLLAKANNRFGSELHAYCLMTNHVHLVVEDHEGNLSKVLRHVKGVHAQRFNRRHDRVGHLFEGRFWNSLLGDDAYLTSAVEYVHRNPVEAGMVGTPIDYPWSSYASYLGLATPHACLSLQPILDMHGGREELRQRTDTAVPGDESLDAFRQDRPSPVLGSEAFCRAAVATAETARDTQASARRGVACTTRPSLTLIRDTVAAEWHIDPASVSTSRRGSKNTPRAVALFLAQSAGWPTNEIADFFGLGSGSAVSTVSTRLDNQRGTNPLLQARIGSVQLVLGGT